MRTRRSPCGCGHLRGCFCQARALSATERWRRRAGRQRLRCIQGRATAAALRSSRAMIGPIINRGMTADSSDLVGNDRQFVGAGSRLGRRAQPKEFEGPTMGLGLGPSARTRRAALRSCGSRRGTATYSARSRITLSGLRGGGRWRALRRQNHPLLSAWRLLDGGSPSVEPLQGIRRELKCSTGLPVEEERLRSGLTSAIAVTPSTAASGRRSTPSRPTNCASGRQKKSHKCTSWRRLAAGATPTTAAAWRVAAPAASARWGTAVAVPTTRPLTLPRLGPGMPAGGTALTAWVAV
jgi:hypothetical protein